MIFDFLGITSVGTVCGNVITDVFISLVEEISLAITPVNSSINIFNPYTRPMIFDFLGITSVGTISDNIINYLSISLDVIILVIYPFNVLFIIFIS